MTSQTNFFSGSISHRILGVGKLKFSGNVQHVSPLIGLELPGCHGNGSGVMGVGIFGEKNRSAGWTRHLLTISNDKSRLKKS
jgi:hypothetical protein